MPVVKLAPTNQQSVTFYDYGLTTLGDTVFKQEYEDTIFKEDEDQAQDAVKNKVFSKLYFTLPIMQTNHLGKRTTSMGKYKSKKNSKTMQMI